MTEEEYLKEITSHQKRIYGFLKSLHPYPAEVEDILQESNITLITKYRDFDSSKDFTPWAFTIARWTWMAYKQKRRRNLEKVTHFPQETNAEGFEYLIDPLSSTTVKEATERDCFRREVLNKASQKLLPVEKVILEMSFEGKSLSAIAQELGASYGATCARKRRLLIKLKKIVRHETSILQTS